MPSTIPKLLLERLAHGELSEEEQRRIMRRHDCDASQLDALLLELRRSDRDILAAHSPSEYVKSVENLLAQPAVASPPARHARRSWLALPVALAAASAALAAVALLSSPPVQHEGGAQEDVILLKGEKVAPLRVWRAAQPSNQRLRAGDEVREGDTLQLEYSSARDTAGVIFSIDGRGVTTLHHPDTRQGDAVLREGTHLLPYSYTLDDAPDYERFFLVECPHEVDVKALLMGVESFARSHDSDSELNIPALDDCHSHSMWLKKEAPKP